MDDALREAISQVLARFPEITAALLFGSRAKGGARAYSDIDLALCGRVGDDTVQRVLYELDELPTAYTFDLAAFDGVQDDALRAHIERVGVLIYQKKA